MNGMVQGNSMPKMTDEEKQYRAENDARTLKEAAMIGMDDERHGMAREVMHKEMAAMQTMMEDKAKSRFPKTYKKEA